MSDGWGADPVVKRIVVEVPRKHLDLADSLAAKTYNEFMWYSRATVSLEDATVVVRISDEVYFPEQEVSGSTCEPTDEELKRISEANYNAVFHRHPSGVHSFSGTDDDYINSNNDVSVLYADGKFVEATVRLKLAIGGIVVMKADEIKVVGNDINVDEFLKKLKTKNYGDYRYYGSGYYDYYGYSRKKFTSKKDILAEFDAIKRAVSGDLKEYVEFAKEAYLANNYFVAHQYLADLMELVATKKLRNRIRDLADEMYDLYLLYSGYDYGGEWG